MVPIVDAWIKRIAGWVERRPGRFLIVAGGVNALFVLAFGSLSKFPEDGPNGVDLQLSLSANVFNQIVTYWMEAGFNIAKFRWTVAGLDFLFPVAYATFLCGAYQLVCRGALLEPRRLVQVAPFAALAADYLENVVMLWLLWQPLPPAGLLVRLMSGAAIIKFGLLTATTAIILAAIIKGDAWRVLKIARYTVLSLLVGTLPLLLLPQGRDLLTSLSHPAAFWHRFWFVLWLIVWALSTWYWSRVLLDAEADRGESPEFTGWSTWLPRVIGAATLIVPGLAILGGVPDSENRLAMVILGLSCLVFGAVFLAFVIRRRHRRDHQGYRAAERFAREAVKRPSRLLVVGSLALSGTLFVWFTAASQSAGMTFGAVAILAIVAANTVFFGSIVVFLVEARRLPVEMVALACAAVFSLWNDNHTVVVGGGKPQRETLTADFTRWLASAPGENDKTVVIATGEGGGIRAAYWTAVVLHYLDAAEDKRLRDLQFSRRLYAISTVSGSSFGAAVYAGLKKDRQGAPGQLAVASSVLQRQFLAPMIAKLVTGDVLQWFLPIPVPCFDRSTALEEGFARAYVDRVPAARDTMNDPFTSFAINRPAYMPLLLFNGTSVQSGRRIVTSGVDWIAPGSEADDADPIDFHRSLKADISLARAAHNTARFPYISPAGRLRDQEGSFVGHIVDGGYFENNGADTALDVIQHLDQDKLTANVRFVVIALTNSLKKESTVDPTRVAWRKMKHLGELFAPLRALLQTRDARGTMALNRLKARVKEENFVEFRVCDDKDDNRESRDAPLGWQLSAEMVAELNSQLGLKCFHDSVDKLVRALGTPTP